jgi:hypothetical protein
MEYVILHLQSYEIIQDVCFIIVILNKFKQPKVSFFKWNDPYLIREYCRELYCLLK